MYAPAHASIVADATVDPATDLMADGPALRVGADLYNLDLALQDATVNANNYIASKSSSEI